MIRVNRADLLQRLETVQAGLSPKDIVEQSSSFVFLDGHVVTYNDETACRTASPLGKKFKGAVAAAPLLAILRKLPEDEVELEAADGELVVSGKRRKAGIRMDAEIHLPVDKVDYPEEWKPLHEDFTDAVSLVQECATKDESQFTLTCVHVHPKWVEACDNYQMTRFKLKTGVSGPTLVKRESIKHIIDLGMTELGETENWIHFRNPNGLTVSCRRYMEEYPDLVPFLSGEGGHPATLPKGLVEAAENAEIFSSENVDDNKVTIELKPGKLHISGQGVSGWYSEVKKLAYDGERMEFTISPSLLKEITKRHNDCEINGSTLKVDGGKFIYVTCLGKVGGAEAQEEAAEESE